MRRAVTISPASSSAVIGMPLHPGTSAVEALIPFCRQNAGSSGRRDGAALRGGGDPRGPSSVLAPRAFSRVLTASRPGNHPLSKVPSPCGHRKVHRQPTMALADRGRRNGWHHQATSLFLRIPHWGRRRRLLSIAAGRCCGGGRCSKLKTRKLTPPRRKSASSWRGSLTRPAPKLPAWNCDCRTTPQRRRNWERKSRHQRRRPKRPTSVRPAWRAKSPPRAADFRKTSIC